MVLPDHEKPGASRAVSALVRAMHDGQQVAGEREPRAALASLAVPPFLMVKVARRRRWSQTCSRCGACARAYRVMPCPRAVVRYVARANSRPLLLALTPWLGNQRRPDAWVANQLPFEQDVKVRPPLRLGPLSAFSACGPATSVCALRVRKQLGLGDRLPGRWGPDIAADGAVAARAPCARSGWTFLRWRPGPPSRECPSRPTCAPLRGLTLCPLCCQREHGAVWCMAGAQVSARSAPCHADGATSLGIAAAPAPAGRSRARRWSSFSTRCSSPRAQVRLVVRAADVRGMHLLGSTL